MLDESPAYRFPEGIPAFEDHDSFKLIRDPDLDPFIILVSGKDPNLRFICVQACLLAPDYGFELDSASAMLLGVEKGRCAGSDGRFACLAILSLPSAGPATANLMAPVVIHLNSGVGLQAVQSGGPWSHAEPVGVAGGHRCS